MSEWIIIAGINPIPWKAPTLGTSRKGSRVYPTASKDGELRMFQEAIKEELENYSFPLTEGPITLEFRLWRQLDTYENAKGHTVRKHKADATNMQKALEDALQGILFKNDNQVVKITTTIESQTVNTESRIEILMLEVTE